MPTGILLRSPTGETQGRSLIYLEAVTLFRLRFSAFDFLLGFAVQSRCRVRQEPATIHASGPTTLQGRGTTTKWRYI
jgi:hypothetical protein